MPDLPKISSECLQELQSLVWTLCPCAMEESQLFPALTEIFQEELLRAVRAERQSFFQKHTKPNWQ